MENDDLGRSDSVIQLPLDTRIRGAMREYDYLLDLSLRGIKSGETTLDDIAEGVVEIYDRWGIDDEGRLKIDEIHSRRRGVAEVNVGNEMKRILSNPYAYVIMPRTLANITVKYAKFRFEGMRDRIKGKY